MVEQLLSKLSNDRFKLIHGGKVLLTKQDNFDSARSFMIETTIWLGEYQLKVTNGWFTELERDVVWSSDHARKELFARVIAEVSERLNLDEILEELDAE